MSQNTLDQINAIREKAEKEIAALKAKAISELAQKINAAKEVLRTLDEEYKKLTGKDLKGEKVAGKRRRLSADDKNALVDAIKSILKSHKDGVKISLIVEQTGQPVSAIRTALNSMKEVKKSGDRASTLYSLK